MAKKVLDADIPAMTPVQLCQELQEARNSIRNHRRAKGPHYDPVDAELYRDALPEGSGKREMKKMMSVKPKPRGQKKDAQGRVLTISRLQLVHSRKEESNDDQEK